MPSPSPGKCRGSVVRQLSLQNQTPVQSPAPRRGLKKQFSEDDSKILTSVEITGLGWTSGSQKAESMLRVGSADGKVGKAVVSRPKPVKVAWSERKQDSTECPTGVEVVATKCQGQPRPLSVKPQRLKNPMLGEKDTLVYTRMQLAERLRNAWRERDKTKPNLNIFLAHASSAAAAENGPASDRVCSSSSPCDDQLQDTASTMSETSAPLDKKRKSMQVRVFSRDFCPSDSLLPECFLKKDEIPEQKEAPKIEITESTPRNEDGTPRGCLQELNKIEIKVHRSDQSVVGVVDTVGKLSQLDSGERICEESPMCVKRSRDKENLGSCDNLSLDTNDKGYKNELERKEATAQERRASFRRSSVLHKTITESFSSRLPKEEEDESVDVNEDIKVVTKPKKPPLVRGFSAPSQNDHPSIQTSPNPPKPKVAPPKRLQPTVSFDLSNIEDITALRDRIKSAPVRRKLKSAAARRKNKDRQTDSSEDEKDVKEVAANSSKKTTRRKQTSKNGGDIVTMVSLVSPAESDTEDSVILPVESWTKEEKEDAAKSSTNSSSKGSDSTKEVSSFILQKFVSLRKTTKTVSFLSQPPINRNYSASFPSRRAPAGTPIIIPTPVVNSPALTPAQLQEREKRPPNFSTINSTTDGRGIKRRLIRSSTEPPKEEDSISENSQITRSVILDNVPEHGGKKEEGGNVEEEEEKTNGEPEFKSPKEKECWKLYQKMLAKGVSVSFDTVLRGMLTPTEYRLRKNQLLSTY